MSSAFCSRRDVTGVYGYHIPVRAVQTYASCVDHLRDCPSPGDVVDDQDCTSYGLGKNGARVDRRRRRHRQARNTERISQLL